MAETGDRDLAAARPDIGVLDGAVLARGWNAPSDRAYGSAAALRELERLARHGARAVVLDAVGLVSRPDSPFVEAVLADREQRLLRFTAMADHARSLGLRVVLRARLDVQDGSPPTQIGPRDDRDRTKWFAEQGRWLLAIATLAREIRADLFVIGSSLSRTTHHEVEWRALIADLRRVVDVPLSYGADVGDELERIRFWDALDLVGADVFIPLSRPSDLDPTPRPRPSVWSAADEDSVAVHELATALAPHRERLARVARREGRPALITSIGYRSTEASWRDPAGPLGRFVPVDERDQRRAVAGALRAFAGRPWLRGMLWWHWDVTPSVEDTDARRDHARSFSLRDKLAAEELRRSWSAPPLGLAAARVEGRGGMVVSSDSVATAVGVQVLRDGGTAADAAVATAFALAVTLPEAGNLGGGGFAVSWDPRRRRARALDFRERAPLHAHGDLYLELAREGITDGSTRGPLAAGIPGTVAGLHALWEVEGELPWERLLRPAFELAIDGFVVGAATEATLRNQRRKLQAFGGTRAVFLPDGHLPREGERLHQPALAATLLTLMREGPAAFYRGAIARQLVEGVRAAGGLWTEEDLATYQPLWRRPVRWPLTRDGRAELLTIGPPSSAGTVLPQVWSFLAAQRAARFDPVSVDRAHAFVEAFRLAFADRNQHLADPQWMEIAPRALVTPDYLRERARLLPPRGVSGRSALVDAGWPAPSPWRESDETTHLVVIDARGRSVSLTTTLNGLFGCGWLEKRTGVLLNNQMDDFDTHPGEPNLYGLVGSGMNRVRPGARMLSSTSPVIVLRDGRSWLALGGRGGPRILTALAQVLHLRVVDGWPLERAVAAPRLHHQWWPDVVNLEEGRTWPDLTDELRSLGHEVESWTKSGKIHAAEMTSDGRFVGVADPRERGLARAVDGVVEPAVDLPDAPR